MTLLKAQRFLMCSIFAMLIKEGLLQTPGSCRDMPNSEVIVVPESTEVGSVLYEKEMDLEDVISLEIRHNEIEDAGYLRIEKPNYGEVGQIKIILERSLDLIQMNPLLPPYPNTQENVTCGYNRTNTPICYPEGAKMTIDYTILCENNFMTSPSDFSVYIEEVNDEQPYFMCAPYYKTISEYTVVGSTIFTMSGLGADPEITGCIGNYGLVDSMDGTFTVTGGTDVRSISLAKKLDYNFGAQRYSLNITVTDSLIPPLSNWAGLFLEIKDEDDLNPIFDFEEYTISFLEEDPDLIGKPKPTLPPVFAYDQDFGINASIKYRLLSGHIIHDLTYFSFDENNGRLIPMRLLDRESISSFSLLIQAYQEDNPIKRTAVSQIAVSVEDINDNPPVMGDTSYFVDIPENMPNGLSVLGVDATDLDEGDNAVFNFYIIDDEGAFYIDPITGQITVANSIALDRERKPVFELKVYAQETLTVERLRSEESTIRVRLIDINDNNPIFYPSDRYTFLPVQTPETGGIQIGTVFANDTDEGVNAMVRYSITGSSSDDYSWSVNPTTGTVSLISDIPGLPVDQAVSLVITATDQAEIIGQRRSSTCIAKVNLIATDITTSTTTVVVTTQTSTRETTVGETTKVPTTEATTVHVTSVRETTTGPTTVETTVLTTSAPETTPSTPTPAPPYTSEGSTTNGQTTAGTTLLQTNSAPMITSSVSSSPTSQDASTYRTMSSLTSSTSSVPPSSPPASSSSSTRPTVDMSWTSGHNNTTTPGTTGCPGPELLKPSDYDLLFILTIVFAALTLLFGLAFVVTGVKLARLTSELEDEEENITKDVNQIAHLTGTEEAPFSSTDTDNTSARTTPSLGTERSALKDNVYATLDNNTLVDNRKPAPPVPLRKASTEPFNNKTLAAYDSVEIGAVHFNI